jgi:hypothetical protein
MLLYDESFRKVMGYALSLNTRFIALAMSSEPDWQTAAAQSDQAVGIFCA